MEDKKEAIRKLARIEGFTIEESTVIYDARSELPATAFCGPNRSYPASSVKDVLESFSRLAQFGKRLDDVTKTRILSNLKSKAKRFGVEQNPSIQFHLKVLETPVDTAKGIVDRFLKTEFPSLSKKPEKPKFDPTKIREWYDSLTKDSD